MYVKCNFVKLYCCSYYGVCEVILLKDYVLPGAPLETYGDYSHVHTATFSVCVPLDISLTQRFMRFIKTAFNHSSLICSIIAKWLCVSRGRAVVQTIAKYLANIIAGGTLSPNDINNK